MRFLVFLIVAAIGVAALVFWVIRFQPESPTLDDGLTPRGATHVLIYGPDPAARGAVLARLRPLLGDRPPRSIDPASGGEHLRRLELPQLELLRDDDRQVLVAIVDGGGKIREVWIDAPGDPAPEQQIARAASFRSGLDRRPRLHALMNGTCALLLIFGYGLIRAGNLKGHLACMGLASLLSLVFLASYVYYHYHAGSVSYPGTGSLRTLYLAILLSHIVLAALNLPLVMLVLYRTMRREFGLHRRIARWTLPIWLYVSVTGVLVYLMLYQL